MIGMSQILLSHLKLYHELCMRHGAEQRTVRLARLEIYRPVLYLNYNIVEELSVERFKLKICLLGTVGIARAIDECAPHYYSSVRFQCGCQHIGSFGMSAVIIARTGLSF